VPPGGSGSIRSYTIAKQLVKKGYDITLITTSARFKRGFKLKNKINHLKIEGIELIVLKISYSNRFSYFRRIKAFVEYAVLATLLSKKSHRFDLIFASSTPLTVAIPALIAKIWHRIPLIFEVRDLWPEVPIAMGVIRKRWLIWVLLQLEKLIYRRAEHIIALSPDMKDSIVETQVPEEKVSVIPNFSDNELFSVETENREEFQKKIPFLGSKPLVIYTGTFGTVNDLSYLIRLAAAMRQLDPETTFVLVGTGKEEEKLRILAARTGVINRNLWFLPPVAKKSLPGIISCATVTVSTVANNPALWKNSANKLFDAFAAGKPIMINHYGWQAELLRRRNAGLVVPPEDPTRGAHLLHEFIHDHQRYALACSEAKRLAEEQFDSSSLVGKIEAIIASILRTEPVITGPFSAS